MPNRFDMLGVEYRIEFKEKSPILLDNSWKEIGYDIEGKSEEQMNEIFNVLSYYFPTKWYRIVVTSISEIDGERRDIMKTYQSDYKLKEGD